MRELGISIYPDRLDQQEMFEYMEKAASHGFTRIFTNLISVATRESLDTFTKMIDYAHHLGFKVVADISPQVFKDLNCDYRDLTLFAEMGLYGIRLDEGFSGMEESIMSINHHNLKIELNISAQNRVLENILSHVPNMDNIIGCHNFYPHRYTGLSRETLESTSQRFKAANIRTAAFVSSQTGNIGPWEVDEGLPTLEEHRELSIVTQAKDLWNTGLIDDVIVSNAYATDQELMELGKLNRNVLSLRVETIEDISPVEMDLLFNILHINRGDTSEYMIRSSMTRVICQGMDFPLKNPRNIAKGDVLIESSLYKRYAGEMQLALKPMKNSGKTSVIGKIIDEEIHLLDKIKPWQKFILQPK